MHLQIRFIILILAAYLGPLGTEEAYSAKASQIHPAAVREKLGCASTLDIKECFAINAKYFRNSRLVHYTKASLTIRSGKVFREWNSSSSLDYFPVKLDKNRFFTVAEVSKPANVTSFILFDFKGSRELRLKGMPIFSSDGKYFAVSAEYSTAVAGWEDFQIWRATDIAPEYTITDFRSGYVPRGVQWSSKSMIRLYIGTIGMKEYKQMSSVSIVRQGPGKWKCQTLSVMILC